jgi:hypothetical protein
LPYALTRDSAQLSYLIEAESFIPELQDFPFSSSKSPLLFLAAEFSPLNGGSGGFAGVTQFSPPVAGIQKWQTTFTACNWPPFALTINASSFNQ